MYLLTYSMYTHIISIEATLIRAPFSHVLLILLTPLQSLTF